MIYPSGVPMEGGVHGGQDVGVWATGPQSFLFSGHYEQNSIPLLMAYILQIGPYAEDEKCEASLKTPMSLLIVLLVLLNLNFKFLTL